MRMNQLKAGVLLSYASIIIGVLISVIYTPVMIRMLGKSEYGLYNLVSSVVSYLGILSFGFSSAYLKFYILYKNKGEEEQIQKLNGMFISIYMVVSIIAFLIGLALTANVDYIFSDGLNEKEKDTAQILMIFLVINISISFPASVFEANVAANEQYIFQKSIQVIKTVLNPILAFPLLFFGYKSISLVLVSTLLSISSLCINIFFCLKKLNMKFSFGNFDRSIFVNIIFFSGFIFLNMITDQINWSTDKFILGRFGGTDEVAVYSVGAQINSYYLSLSMAISSIFIPRVNSMVAQDRKNEDFLKLMIKVGRIQYLILSYILGGFIVLGSYFIKLWAGNGYGYNSYIVTLLLIIPVTIPAVQNIGIEIQKAENVHKFRSVVYFLIAVGNISFSIPLSMKYGAVGAAIGTFFSLILGNGLVMNWYYSAKMKLDMKCFWKEIIRLVPMSVISVFFTVILSVIWTIDTIGTFIIAGLFYSIIYVSIYYHKGMNEYEKNMFSNLFQAIRRK